MVSILGLTPLLGFAIRLIPLQPTEYIIGIVVMCVVPTSLGVGIALVTSAKVSYIVMVQMCGCSNCYLVHCLDAAADEGMI